MARDEILAEKLGQKRVGVRFPTFSPNLMVITLPAMSGPTKKSEPIGFWLPPEIRGIRPEENLGDLAINVCEEGGKVRDGSGDARVVCGLSGRPLKPFLILDQDSGGNRKVAHFSVPWKVITVRCQKKVAGTFVFKLTRLSIDRSPEERVVINRDTIWEGIELAAAPLPNIPEPFADAVYAARQRASGMPGVCYAEGFKILGS